MPSSNRLTIIQAKLSHPICVKQQTKKLTVIQAKILLCKLLNEIYSNNNIAFDIYLTIPAKNVLSKIVL